MLDISNALPQKGQKRAPSGTGFPHCEQNIAVRFDGFVIDATNIRTNDHNTK